MPQPQEQQRTDHWHGPHTARNDALRQIDLWRSRADTLEVLLQALPEPMSAEAALALRRTLQQLQGHGA
jgi:hypothetical protein